MTAPAYIPGPDGPAAAQARATTLGVGIAPTEIPPVYQPYVTTVPGVIVEGGGLIAYMADDGTKTAQDVANLVAPIDTAITAQQTTAGNQQTLRQRAAAALTANATFLALASPSNVQTLAQVQMLTRECTALIRLLLNQFDSTSGT